MVKNRNNDGFSLVEILMAMGILAVGMIFIAGVFPVAIYFSTVATERTIASVVAEEAFAKIRLYAINDPQPPYRMVNLSKLATDQLKDFNDVDIFPAVKYMDPNGVEFSYPSDPNISISQRQYYWTALCRLTEEVKDSNDPHRLVEVTVFVSRKMGSGGSYRDPEEPTSKVVSYPRPVKVGISKVAGNEDELKIEKVEEKIFINDSYEIVDDKTGQTYRVLERYPVERDDAIILLDRKWEGGDSGTVWVVPPPVNGGRGPCVAIYQKVIRF